MNQWKMLDFFCEIAKENIETLDETDLNYDLLKYQIDEQGPCCSDYELLEAFEANCKLDKNALYPIVEKICSEYCKYIH
jgi:hypothetical protein